MADLGINLDGFSSATWGVGLLFEQAPKSAKYVNTEPIFSVIGYFIFVPDLDVLDVEHALLGPRYWYNNF